MIESGEPLSDADEKRIKEKVAECDKALALLSEAKKNNKPYRAATAAYDAFLAALDGAAIRLGVETSDASGITGTSNGVSSALEAHCMGSHALAVIFMGREPSPENITAKRVMRIVSMAEESAYNLSSIARGGTVNS